MKKSLKDMLPLAEAVSRLLHPFAEVVIHDLKKDKIEAIFNPFSRRQVGDESYFDRVEFDTGQSVIGPYDKTNWDGRPLKSISVVIRNQEGKPEGFLCVNIDTSAFVSASQIIEAFLTNNADIPHETQQIFKDDLYEKINTYVQQYCREKQVSIDSLSRNEKREIITSLEADGAFEGKNAANYIGRVLKISRATVYNYLKKD